MKSRSRKHKAGPKFMYVFKKKDGCAVERLVQELGKTRSRSLLVPCYTVEKDDV